jgi:hypothetical protein
MAADVRSRDTRMRSEIGKRGYRIGARAFPERFLGLVAVGACRDDSDTSEWTTTGLAKFIGPSASANVLGRTNAIASAIVVSFMKDRSLFV